MQVSLARSALSVMAGAMSTAVAPPAPMPPSDWAEKNLKLPDGPLANEFWRRDMALHTVEIVDVFDPDNPVNEAAVMKSAQTAFTTALIIAAGYSIDRDPCRMMLVQPTSGALYDFNKEKLQPAIEASPVLARKVRPQSSRSGDGSTATSKQFAGGSLILAIASSAADLRSKTIKKTLLDEIDEYPDDLDGQGDPIDMIEARQISFLASGDWKRLKASTPTIKGASKIEAAYLAGDQRRWHVKCPGCGDRFVFEFDREHFRFNDEPPYNAHYVTPCCGTIIEGHEKNAVYRTGKWIPTAERPGAGRSYHFDAMSSPLVPWDEIAKKFCGIDGDPVKAKTFYNLWLGLPYEVRGDAPDHVRLLERRDGDLVRGHIPPLGLILTGAADVQLRGIYYEIKAYGPDRQKWIVDAGILEGDTNDPHAGAFLKLTEVFERSYPDAYGGSRRVDAFGVDSGYRSHVVYTWVRGRVGAFALKGLDGWSRPALGTGQAVDIDYNGKRIRNGVHVWGVGTWPLKAAHYDDLRKEGKKSGKETDPPGYVHFGSWLDEVYFRQITSEYLANENYRGRVRRVWKVRNGEENHFLDCTIYNDALADYLGLSRMTQEEWAALASDRCAPEVVKRPDLFSPDPLAVQKPPAPDAASIASPASRGTDRDDDDIGSYWDDY
ncbi:phage terminase large subunit family protein [Oricola thermophila]|uniref:Phage terminase large subunit family protein n=1 Tax=Oricola thermophila TaxID=2742145 RepID=A0A6N1VLG7_9HYPH|nr:terminase gpA endonuclease subunit [Oricola thermophila]QKV20252.1 phage terminase large subunit family protein [Oricola thermophila]